MLAFPAIAMWLPDWLEEHTRSIATPVDEAAVRAGRASARLRDPCRCRSLDSGRQEQLHVWREAARAFVAGLRQISH